MKHLLYFLQFEWALIRKNPLSYAIPLLFGTIGFVLASVANFSLGMAAYNSPYTITYITSLSSLGLIFFTTLVSANSLLREMDSKFESVLFALPLSKIHFLLGRQLFIFLLATLCFGALILGMMIGFEMPWLPQNKLVTYNTWYFIQPYLIFIIPNTLLCIGTLSLMAWSTRNKLIVYVSGLMLYIVYIAGSIFSNSPIIAGSSPIDANTEFWSSLLDPFGLAAMFSQTKYWTLQERNNNLISVTNILMLNRFLWIGVSILLCTAAINVFRFNGRNVKRKFKRDDQILDNMTSEYTPVSQTPFSLKYNWQCLISQLKIDLTSIVRGITFKLVLIIWCFIYLLELYSSIEGGSRIPSFYTSTPLVINVILETLPGFSLLIILFFGSETVFRSKTVGISSLENASAFNPYIQTLAKIISTSFIPFALIIFSIVTGIIAQYVNNYPVIDIKGYLSLLIYCGLPFVLCSSASVLIQLSFRNRYIGLIMASIILLLTNSKLGVQLIGLNHPLTRFANTMQPVYGDMNGFGGYVSSFWSAQLIATLIVSTLFIFFAHASKSEKINPSSLSRNIKMAGLVSFTFLVLAIGYTYYNLSIKNNYRTEKEMLYFKEGYEKKYRQFSDTRMPVITSVKCNIELFPENNKYQVHGKYKIKNNGKYPIDSILLYLDPDVVMNSISISNAKLLLNDKEYGHCWFRSLNKIMPGESTELEFSVSATWNPLLRPNVFNSILANGSFIRISDYLPQFGYQPSREIKSETERARRGLPEATMAKSVDAAEVTNEPYIHVDAIISTSLDQTAFGIGDLDSVWTSNNRSYFHYLTKQPIPNRYAVASGKYVVNRMDYKGVQIEIYHHQLHNKNAAYFLEYAKTSLDYCNSNFNQYKQGTIRFVEIAKIVKGVAGIAYPGTIFINEDYAFQSDISENAQPDVVNELAGHELSHYWWGAYEIVPDGREGSRVLTETLAMYTELMLYQKRHGKERALELVKLHLALYLSERGQTKEKPLINAQPSESHLFYDKGLVVMHQLTQLLGEDSINIALQRILKNHAYPNQPPTASTLIDEFKRVATNDNQVEITERFAEVVTHDIAIDTARLVQLEKNKFVLTIAGKVNKYFEDGLGGRQILFPSGSIDLLIQYSSKSDLHKIKYENGIFKTDFITTDRALKIIIDPHLLLIDLNLENNEKQIY